MNWTSLYRVIPVGLLAGLLGLLAACSGEVYVSDPEVFTRERLVDERLRESQWILNQLSVSDTIQTTFQGLSDQSKLQALQNQLAVNLVGSPGLGAPTTAATQATALAAIPSGLPTGNPTTTAAQESPEDLFNDKLAYRDAVYSALHDTELDDTHDLRGRTLYNLKFDIGLVPRHNNGDYALVMLKFENATPTAQVGDFKSPQGRINYKTYSLWVQSLNDEFESDTRDSEARLLANKLSQNYLEGVASALASDLPDTFLLIGNWTYADQLEGYGYERYFQQATGKSLSAVQASLAKFLISNATERGSFSSATDKTTVTKDDWDNLKFAVAFSVYAKYLKTFHDYVPFGRIISLHDPYSNTNYYLNSIRLPPDKLNKPTTRDTVVPEKSAKQTTRDTLVLDDLKDWRKRYKKFNEELNEITDESNLDEPRVISVQPSEYAQNISDVSRNEDFLDLAATIGAALKTVSIQDQIQYLNESQQLLNAIKRQPLEIGFEDGLGVLGVLIGGPYGIDNQKVSFNQVPTRYSVNAEIAVPGWWSKVRIRARYMWVGDLNWSAKPFDDGKPAWEPTTRVTDVNDSMIVNLPSDPQTITAAIGFFNDRLARAPRITYSESPAEETGYLLQATASGSTGADQTLVIEGTDLWRNPAVFVGARRADSVDVLPDMKGLVAHFSSFPYTTTQPSQESREDLRVITTFGTDSLYQVVRILPPPAAATSAFASLTQHYIMDNTTGNITFALNKSLVPPTGLTGLTLYMRYHGGPVSEWQSISGTPAYSATQIQYTLNSSTALNSDNKLPSGTTARAYDIDLRLSSDPTQPDKSILTGGPQTVLLCSSANDRSVTLSPTPAPLTVDSTGKFSAPIVLTNPVTSPLLVVSYPGFTAAASASPTSITIKLAQQGGPTILLPAAINGQNITAAGPVPADIVKTLSKTQNSYSVTIVYTESDGSTQEIPTNPATLTLTPS
jgi:hypothetical protein